MIKEYGKPFDYFKLGKSFKEGGDFMLYMKQSAESLMQEAKRKDAVILDPRCPICGSDRSNVELELFSFDLSVCSESECGHCFCSTRIPHRLRTDFFKQDNQYSVKNYCNPKVREFRIREIAVPKVQFALRHSHIPSGSWLDIGCGSGDVLLALKEIGWDAKGTELSKEDVDYAKQNDQLDIHLGGLDTLRSDLKNSFDIVSLFGVLHCVDDPLNLLKMAKSFIKPDGFIVTELSHFKSVEFDAVKTYKENPSRTAYNGATTLQHFTENSMLKMFALSGFKPVAIWYYGTDIYEIINQLCFASPLFFESDLYQSILRSSNEIQCSFDKAERSSTILVIARLLNE